MTIANPPRDPEHDIVANRPNWPKRTVPLFVSSAQHSLVELSPHVVATSTSLVITRVTTGEWLDLYDKCQSIHEASNWWLGDLMLVSPSEECTQALDEGSKARVCEWVSRCVGVSTRRASLSWSHHRLIAKHDPDLQDELLEVAERKGFTVTEFTAYLKAFDNASEGKEQTEPKEKLYTTDKQACIALARSREGRTWMSEDTQAISFYLGL